MALLRFRSLCVVFTLLLGFAALSAGAFASGVAVDIWNTPHADVLGRGVMKAGFRLSGGDLAASFGYGVLDSVDVGIVSTQRSGQAGLLGFLKVQLFPETQRSPGLGVGLTGSTGYAVLSKNIAPRLRLHGGFGSGGQGGPFVGATYLVNPVVVSRPGSLQAPRVTLMAEYDTHKVNAGARLGFAQGLDIDVVMEGLNEFGAGLSWRTQF